MPGRLQNALGPLTAAAMVARDARLTVRVVLPSARADTGFVAELAAEHAGVDAAVEPNIGGATVHFIPRHQDRAVVTRSRDGLANLRRIARWVRPKRSVSTRATLYGGVDLLAFRRASDALELSVMSEHEDALIWQRLLCAHPQAHFCGGIPTLVLNDVGGLVGILRRRAHGRAAHVRINPEVCGCR